MLWVDPKNIGMLTPKHSDFGEFVAAMTLPLSWYYSRYPREYPGGRYVASDVPAPAPSPGGGAVDAALVGWNLDGSRGRVQGGIAALSRGGQQQQGHEALQHAD